MADSHEKRLTASLNSNMQKVSDENESVLLSQNRHADHEESDKCDQG